MTPGSLCILLAAVLGAAAWISAIRWSLGNPSAEKTFRWTYHGMTAVLGLATALLMVAILTHDFRFDYVIGYSSRDLPLLYLVSAFWGGQQGTFLLWALAGALIGYPLFRKRSWEPATVMACYVPTILYMVVLMLDRGGNPFTLAASIPADGRGLNPLLQDPWMAIHPPMVFLGYAAMTVPAALALAALLKHEETKWLDNGLRWSLLGWISLGAGVILGGFWAYKVLGWGGFWGWDPVENASLIPWIVVTALLHGLLVQRATGALRRTNLVLALSGYVLVLYATFLTRSGVLADFSVHSFPRGSLYRVLVGIMLVTLVVSAFALLRRKAEKGAEIEPNGAWPFMLSIVLGLLMVSAVVVLVGTSWPMISSLVNRPAVPEGGFYNRASLPLYLVLLAILGYVPYAGWRVASYRPALVKAGVSAAVALAATIAAALLGGHGVLFLALFFMGVFALASNLWKLATVGRVRLLNTGAALAHVGFALMMVGVVASSAWDREQEVALPLGQPVEALGRILTYRGHIDGTAPRDEWRVAVLEPGGAETTARVRMYQIDSNSPEPQLMRNPAILRALGEDLYLAPLGLDPGTTHDLVLTQGQPVDVHGAKLTFVKYRTSTDASGQHMRVEAIVEIAPGSGNSETVALPVVMSQAGLQGEPVRPASLPGVTLTFQRMAVEQRQVMVSMREGAASETLVVEASIKPMMNVLWSGTILMLLGCGVAVTRRYLDHRAALAAAPVATIETVAKGARRKRSTAARTAQRARG